MSDHLVLLALLTLLVVPPSLGSLGDETASLEPSLREFSDRMFAGLRTTPETCDASGQGGQVVSLCAPFQGSFSSFKFHWESEIRVHYAGVARPRGSWRLRTGGYQREYDFEGYTLGVQFEEHRGHVELTFREPAEPAEPGPETPGVESTTAMRSAAEMACDDEQEPFDDPALVTDAVLIRDSKVSPLYPNRARWMRIDGRVVLRARIGDDGQVLESWVLEAQPDGSGFEQAAMDAVAQWRYEPAMLGGEPIEVCMTIHVNFRIH